MNLCSIIPVPQSSWMYEGPYVMLLTHLVEKYPEYVQEALKTVLENCSIDSYATLLERHRKEKKEQQEERRQQRAERYPSQGKPWTPAEDKRLRILLNSGYTIPHIANILKHSPSSVRTRLERQKT